MHAELASSATLPGAVSETVSYHAGTYCAYCGHVISADRPERARVVFVRSDNSRTERRVYHLCPECLLEAVGEFERRHEAAMKRLVYG